MRHKWFVLVLLLVLTACGGAAEPSRSEAPSDMVESEGAAAPPMEVPAAEESGGDTAGAGGNPAAQAQANRQIIYTAYLQLRVDDPMATAQALQGVARGFNGFVSSTNLFETSNDTYQGSVQLRIGADQFDAAMEELRGMATEVINERLDTADVTDQYVDLEARIRNLEATEEELRALLTEVRERNNSRTDDILAVHRELTTIRGEIEVYQGQLNSLADQVTLATINVDLYPPEAQVEIVDEGWSPARTFREALRALTDLFQGLGTLAIWLVTLGLPVLLILSVVVFILIQLMRWLASRARNAVNSTTPPPTAPPAD